MKDKYSYDPIRGFYSKTAPVRPEVNGLDFDKIPPLLRTLLVTDGTVTKLLEAYCWEPIKVETLFQGEVVVDHDVPELDTPAGSAVLKRQVVLHGLRSNRIYIYAESFIRADRLWKGVREDLLSGRLGIGELLHDRRLETYREILRVGREEVGDLAAVMKLRKIFGKEPLLYRTYRIFHSQQPIMLITEKFPVSQFMK
jgi:chorismate-pyruvate lyase